MAKFRIHHLNRWLLALLLACSGSSAFAKGDTQLNTGLRGSSGLYEGFLDLLQPVAGDGEDAPLFFINPRFSLSDRSAREFNIGAGIRKSTDAGIIGVNAYFDHRRTERETHFSQLGFGLEWLSSHLDARFNAYLGDDNAEIIASKNTRSDQTEVVRRNEFSEPYATGHQILQIQTRSVETTTTSTYRTYEQFESARSGYDIEFGLNIPTGDTVQTRLFAGYYDFEDEFGQQVDGPMVRLEIRAGHSFTFDLQWYDDAELNGSNTYVGVRFHHLFGDKASASPRNRISEQVIRDMRIQTDITDFIENTNRKKIAVNTKTEKCRSKQVLLDDVNFVDNSKTASSQYGTFEHPYLEIQSGIDNAFGARNVYVEGSGASVYSENVQVGAGTSLFGSGAAVMAFDNRKFGSNVRPVIDGTGQGPSVRMHPNTLLKGFEIINSGGNVGVSEFPIAEGVIVDSSHAGIVGEDLSGSIVIEDNYIHDVTYGLLLNASGTTIDILNNTITTRATVDTASSALVIHIDDDADVTANIADNRFESITTVNQTLETIQIQVEDNAQLSANFSNNTIVATLDSNVAGVVNPDIINIYVANDSRTNLVFHGDHLISHSVSTEPDPVFPDGIFVDLHDNAEISIRLEQATVEGVVDHGGFDGIQIDGHGEGAGVVRFDVIDSTVLATTRINGGAPDLFDVQLEGNESAYINIVDSYLYGETHDDGAGIDAFDLGTANNSELEFHLVDSDVKLVSTDLTNTGMDFFDTSQSHNSNARFYVSGSTFISDDAAGAAEGIDNSTNHTATSSFEFDNIVIELESDAFEMRTSSSGKSSLSVTNSTINSEQESAFNILDDSTCLSASNNTISSGPGDDDFLLAAGSDVSHISAAALSAANAGASVDDSGANFGVVCP
jgi:hypothetical protein